MTITTTNTRRKLHCSTFLALALLGGCTEPPVDVSAPPMAYETVILGGTVYTGEDSPPIMADIAINDQHIAAVGDLGNWTADTEIDASGLAVMPGFIDIHSHALRSDPEDGGILRWPDAENLIRQGVTFVVGGNDGASPVPLAPSFAEIAELPPAIHFASFVGHGSVRSAVVGEEDRPATSEELDAMRAQVAEAMEQGAFGLSSGLIYAPGRFADTDEVVALAAATAPYNGMYISHMREEGLGLIDSVNETIAVGERAGIPTQLTHHKVVGYPMWGSSEETLRLVDEAIARGVDVSIDQYPYTASSTNLQILFPGWSLDGGRQALLARAADPDQRAQLRRDIAHNIEVDRGGNDPANVVLAGCPHDPSLNGMNLSQVLVQQGRERTNNNAAELLIELVEAGNCSAVFHAMVEEDVLRIMQHPRTMIASDGGVEAPSDRAVHPRNYGTFARFLSHYTQDLQVVPMHTAVHKITRMPADRLNIDDRGRLETGAFADIAMLDLDAIQELTTFAEPHQYAEGAVHVLVNGEPVLLNGQMTGARPGQIVRSSDYR